MKTPVNTVACGGQFAGKKICPLFNLSISYFLYFHFMDLESFIGTLASLLGIYSFLKNDTSLFPSKKKLNVVQMLCRF
ncbi:hypothetical protein GCM10023230_29810 [Flavobacterium hankyongi]|uniref:Uncharacterized protein n=1 Tax=Flavobacterium hankyongi TaxID=1176532 RepID=A0ABP9ACB6_9FLAO